MLEKASFEEASKDKYRFTTPKGEISTEDLWDVPLLSRSKFSLDLIARNISKELKETGEESFVKPLTISNTLLTRKFEIVKHVIAVKIAEAEEAKTAANKKAQRVKILGIIADKQDEQLKGKTLEELTAELEKL